MSAQWVFMCVGTTLAASGATTLLLSRERLIGGLALVAGVLFWLIAATL
jgi:hypothetical protein